MLTLLSNAARALRARLERQRELWRAEEELYRLDDRSLADIGISRSEIPFLLAQTEEAPEAARSDFGPGKMRHAA